MAQQKTGIFDKQQQDDYQVPLMNVFRAAFEAHDGQKRDAEDQIDGADKKVSARSLEHREGAGLDKLRAYLLQDLANLMSTIHLEAAQDLTGLPNVRRSVLNYGVLDVTRLSAAQAQDKSLETRFRQALLDHEPRLIAETVKVTLRNVEGTGYHSVSFDVEAVMAARPVDVPLEFVAEIDVGAGKVQMAKLLVNE